MTSGLANRQRGIAQDASGRTVWDQYDQWELGFAGLARYVSQLSLRDLGWNPDLGDLLTSGADGPTADRAIAKRLFERLKQFGISYAIEPWTGLERQQIRHPRWLVADQWGTCLDLAVTYAAMCLDAHVRALLAITGTHALVVLDPGSLRGDGDVVAWGRSWSADLEGDGVAEVLDTKALATELDAGTLMAVDVVEATTIGDDFDAALRSGRKWLERGAILVDVAYLQATKKAEPLPPPDERPTIRTYLPGGQRQFERYESHAAVLDALRGDSGVTVLLGPQGRGKSTIARQIVRDAPFGAGWFLNASEPQTLISSFADADRSEHNQRATELPGADRRGYFEGARSRLDAAEGRWIVVLDNADGDPGKIAPLIPRPGEGQLVLITTTNPEWENVAGVRVRKLPPIEDDRIAGDLDGGHLVPLVAGRALLLHAFKALMASTGATPDQVAALTPARGDVPEPLRGPAALWAAIRTRLDAAEVRFCLQMAYLPPDQQPLESLLELNAGARGTVARLAEAGLVASEARFARMHRLFGAAVRADLRATDPALDQDVVLELATSRAAYEVLDRYGDQATLMRLDERLTEIDRVSEGPDGRLGEALHAVAELLELAGHTRRSGETFARAERHLQSRPELLADVLHSRARTVNQHHARDESLLREALGWAEEAERMLLATPGRERTADRCLAMQGLLLQKLSAFPREGETTLGLLRDALAVIEEAHRRRVERLDPMDPELARSEFNLAGPHINLAQREPARAREHLDEADRVYASVAERREKIYDVKVHPHIAACIIGQGYVDYYRALLLSAPPVERTAWLRDASRHAEDALRQREALDGSLDFDESRKALRFMAKVTLARQAPAVDPGRSLESVIAEASRELAFAAVQKLPSDTHSLAEPIAAWLFSPALAEVVRAFGADPPAPTTPLEEALAWFEDFSLQWDYRGGQERNLAAARELSPDVERVVMRAAPALGLVGTSPPPGRYYDHVLVLGGLVRACIARPLYAARLLQEGAIEAGDVTALGGFRPLKGDELELAGSLGHAGLEDEFDAMDAGVRLAFSLGEPIEERGEPSEEVGASWAVREYRTAAGVPIRVVGAPSSQPGERRANTADTYAWYASDLVELRGDERVLTVTSDIYVPYQHADALRMLGLPHSVEVDAAGVRPGDADPRLSQEFGPHNYLQEMRSTIRALRALYGAWRDTATPAPNA